MTDFTGHVVSADNEVVPGEPAKVTVSVDNKRNEPPTLKQGNCKASTFSQGELVKVFVDVIDSNGDKVKQGQSPELCVPYAMIGAGRREHTFEFTFYDLGTYTFDWEMEGIREDVVDIRDGIESFSVEVVGEHDPPNGGNGGDDDDDNNNNGGDRDLLQTAIQNPIGTAVVLGTGGVALNKAMDFGD